MPIRTKKTVIHSARLPINDYEGINKMAEKIGPRKINALFCLAVKEFLKKYRNKAPKV